jgi:hypothetical protein
MLLLLPFQEPVEIFRKCGWSWVRFLHCIAYTHHLQVGARGISDILSARADQKGKGLFEVRQASTRE